MEFKRPESVLVVVYTLKAEVLLLQRRTPPVGAWQSVTGALLWSETAKQAAIRELHEETGIDASDRLQDRAMVSRFDIVPEALHLYAEGVGENTEYVFSLLLPDACPIRLKPEEHQAYAWLAAGQAVKTVWSWSNRAAIERIVPMEPHFSHELMPE